MGYLSDEGFEYLSVTKANLLLTTRRRDMQYHVDVVGRNGESHAVYRWCLAYCGVPHLWCPETGDIQWHNRFETNVLRMHDRFWTYLWSPWTGGDIDNFHLVLWAPAIREFEDRWHNHFFFAWSERPSSFSVRSSGV